MIVRVDVAPLLLGVTGLVENAVDDEQDGAGDPPPLTLHDSVTCCVSLFSSVTVTVDDPELPGFTAVGVVAESPKSGVKAEPNAITKASGQGTLELFELHVPPPNVPSIVPVVVGKVLESVSPVTLILPVLSTAIPENS